MIFHYYQIPAMIIIIWSGYFIVRLFYFLYKRKLNKAVKAAKQLATPLILALLMILFMPVKLTEQNMSMHENVIFDNTLPKIEVETIDFEEHQLNQLNQLKKESKNALK